MIESRRAFMKGAVGAGLAFYAILREDALERVHAASDDAAGIPPETLADNEDFWFQIQRAFTVDRSVINLNNGGVSPSPRVVQEAMRRYLEFSNQAPSRNLWSVLDPQVETCRRGLADAFGCDVEEMAITRNASEALEIAINGIDLEPGDEILTTTHDYGRMVDTIKQRVLREGIAIKQFGFPIPPSQDELVRLFEANVTDRTKVILLCHITNLTGQIFPVRRICDMARARGIQTIVDGAHAFAHFVFNGSELGCDYYGTSLHKWLTAPHGTGFLYVRRERIPDLWPLMAAPDPRGGDIRKFEEIGTHPAANRLAIAEALAFYHGIGAERKEARLRRLRDRFVRRLIDHDGATCHTSLNPADSCAIATLDFDGIDPGELTSHLWREHRIIVTPIVHDDFRGIRVTPNVYTMPGEIDVFCDAMESVIRTGLPTG